MKFRRFTSVITLLAMAAVFLTGAFMFYAGAAEEPSSKSNLSEAFSKIQSDDESKDYQGIAQGLIDGMDDVAGYLGNIAVSLFADAGEVDFDKIMEAFQGAVVAATPSDVQSTPTRPAGEEGEEPETKSFEETMGDYAQSIINGNGVIGNVLNADPSEIVGGLSSAINRMSDTVRSGDILSGIGGIGDLGGLSLGDLSSIIDLLGGAGRQTPTTTVKNEESAGTSYSYVYGYSGGSSSSSSSSSGPTYSSSGSGYPAASPYSPVYSASPAGAVTPGAVVTVPTLVDEITTQYYLASSYSDANGALTTVAEGKGLLETTNSISGKKIAGAILVIMSCGVIGAIVIKKSM